MSLLLDEIDKDHEFYCCKLYNKYVFKNKIFIAYVKTQEQTIANVLWLSIVKT